MISNAPLVIHRSRDNSETRLRGQGLGDYCKTCTVHHERSDRISHLNTPRSVPLRGNIVRFGALWTSEIDNAAQGNCAKQRLCRSSRRILDLLGSAAALWKRDAGFCSESDKSTRLHKLS